MAMTIRSVTDFGLTTIERPFRGVGPGRPRAIRLADVTSCCRTRSPEMPTARPTLRYDHPFSRSAISRSTGTISGIMGRRAGAVKGFFPCVFAGLRAVDKAPLNA